MPDLTEHDRDLLRFERQQWRHLGAKEVAVHREYGLSMTSYLQRINALIDRPEALAAEPMLVARLRRLRDQRRRGRAA